MAVTAIAAVYIYNNYLINYAKNEAQPIEKALIKAGAVKKCEKGDGGHGPDNFRPWYNATFETTINKDKAKKLIEQIAIEHGYDLTYTQHPAYPEISGYSGQFRKQSTYGELENGPIEIGLSLYSGGSHLGCRDNSIHYDEENIAIVISLGLPEYK